VVGQTGIHAALRGERCCYEDQEGGCKTAPTGHTGILHLLWILVWELRRLSRALRKACKFDSAKLPQLGLEYCGRRSKSVNSYFITIRIIYG
jgi:hypothetical protein